MDVDFVSATTTTNTKRPLEEDVISTKYARRTSSQATTATSLQRQQRWIGAAAAVGSIANTLSDVHFVYGDIATEAALSSGQDPINIFGSPTKIVPLKTREHAGAALLGALSAGVVASASTSGPGLVPMIPVLQRLTATHLPAVVHAHVYGVNEQLAAVPDHTDLMAARESGAIILVSSSPQGAYDLATVAHLAALRTRQPVIHAVDGPSVVDAEASIKALVPSELSRIIPTSDVAALRQLPDSDSLAVPPVEHVPSIVTSLLNSLSSRYRPFEYVGAPNAELVVVAMGTLATILETTADLLASQGHRVGVVRVRMLRPWSAESLLNVLPTTLRRLVVLDQGTYHGPAPLFLDVLASIQSGEFKSIPQIVSQQLSPAISITFSLAHSLLNADASSIPAQAQAVEAIFWETSSPSSTASFAKLAAEHSSLAVHLQTVTDTSSPSGTAVAAQLRLGALPATTLLPVRIDTANYVAVHSQALLSRFDVAAALREGGILLVNTPLAPADLAAIVPAAVRRSLARRQARLFAINAAAVAAASANISEQQVLYAAFLHLTSAASQASVTLAKALASQFNVALASSALRLVELAPLEEGLMIDPLPTHAVRSVVPQAVTVLDPKKAATPAAVQPLSIEKVALPLTFPEAYAAKATLRPDLRENTFQIKVSVNTRLTADSYDRNVFHVEFDTANTGLKYDIGDALGVHGHNDEQEVLAFLEAYQVDPNAIISLPRDPKRPADGLKQARTARQLFTQVLDIFGRPSRAFYKALLERASDVGEKSKLEHLLSPNGQDEFKSRVAETITFADMLLEFPLTHLSLSELVEFIPPIKPRHYSIASSQKMFPTQVHLLVVAVDWTTPAGKKRFGQCTRYLTALKPGDVVTVSVKASVMRLPPLDSSPVIMAGLGTGMAPFRAFIQERAMRKREGVAVGPMILYFGSRHRSEEYLYGEELEAYHQDGLLTHLRLAFSRDQAKKVYIQHHIAEDGKLLWDYLQSQPGAFYLCGPTWPSGDVKDAIVDGFRTYGGFSTEQAAEAIEQLKAHERYVLEVY